MEACSKLEGQPSSSLIIDRFFHRSCRPVQGAANLVEDPVHKAAGFLGAVFLCDLNGLIDGHDWRNFATVEHLVDRDSQHIAIDHRYPGEFVVLSVRANRLVDGLLVFDGALDEGVAESARARAEAAKFVVGGQIAVSV